jgi:hypothetical protein
MSFIGERCHRPGEVYFTGGACAVLLGWRETTIDMDIKIVADDDEVLRFMPRAKNELGLNIELASPADFVPELPGWQERRVFVRTAGKIHFYHYDFYSQALSKIERSHVKDLADVDNMFKNGYVNPTRLLELYRLVEDQLFRYPAIDPPTLRRDLEALVTRERG